MRTISNVITGIGAVLLVASLSAQAKPDLSGKWTLVPDPNAAAAAPAAPAGGGGGGGRGGGRGGGGGQFCGQECTIVQDATSLTVTRTTQAGEVKAVYKLDGSESKNMQAGRGGAQTEVVSKAAWDGNKVSISTTRDVGGTPVTTKTTLSAAGGEMTVENEGGQGPATTQKYKKG
jgi:hypothetical protein